MVSPPDAAVGEAGGGAVAESMGGDDCVGVGVDDTGCVADVDVDEVGVALGVTPDSDLVAVSDWVRDEALGESESEDSFRVK